MINIACDICYMVMTVTNPNNRGECVFAWLLGAGID